MPLLHSQVSSVLGISCDLADLAYFLRSLMRSMVFVGWLEESYTKQISNCHDVIGCSDEATRKSYRADHHDDLPKIRPEYVGFKGNPENMQ